ncbi:phosphotransferase [Paracoccus sp. (in: a-proteobacteria)]|uniref:phosphotransferase n=1 Tax=Paracoccus sp. TaxID=267 RepID=UPI0035AF8791
MRRKLPNAPDPFAALAALPELAGAEFLHVLRDIPKRLVCEIRLNGARAFLKQFHMGDPAALALGASARLHEVADILGPGPDGVALPLLVLPGQGIIVTGAAPGQALSALLLRANPARRAALVGRAGAWLEHLCRASRERGSFGALYWLGTLDQRMAGGLPEWADRDLVAAHMARLRVEAEPLRGIGVERAVAHGDLTPDNLFLDESTTPSRLTGIDMQHRAVAPVTRDMARFLVWLESRRRRPARDTLNGIAAGEYAALLAVPGLIGADQLPILRFMVGVMALEVYLDTARQPLRRKALARCLHDWAFGSELRA